LLAERKTVEQGCPSLKKESNSTKLNAFLQVDD